MNNSTKEFDKKMHELSVAWLKEQIQNYIEFEKKNRKYNLSTFASEAGISRSALSKILNSATYNSKISIDTIRGIAKVLGTGKNIDDVESLFLNLMLAAGYSTKEVESFAYLSQKHNSVSIVNINRSSNIIGKILYALYQSENFGLIPEYIPNDSDLCVLMSEPDSITKFSFEEDTLIKKWGFVIFNNEYESDFVDEIHRIHESAKETFAVADNQYPLENTKLTIVFTNMVNYKRMLNLSFPQNSFYESVMFIDDKSVIEHPIQTDNNLPCSNLVPDYLIG